MMVIPGYLFSPKFSSEYISLKSGSQAPLFEGAGYVTIRTEPNLNLGVERDLDIAQKIAKILSEAEPGPLKTIERAIKVLGEERAQNLLEQAQQIEVEGGGMLTDDGSQRRTLAVYFLNWSSIRPHRRNAKPSLAPSEPPLLPKPSSNPSPGKSVRL
ncbi:MAG: hypothetical protein HC875_36425 [Anaerolineales bacterium]|nr:hypothetical protein [Anaerolineales bacterium]